MDNTKKDIGIIVGRFQVAELTQGHKRLIKTAVETYNHICIFVGVSPIVNTKNPLSYYQRSRMIYEYIKFLGITTEEVEILPLLDNESNERWVQLLDEAIIAIFGWPKPNQITKTGARAMIGTV